MAKITIEYDDNCHDDMMALKRTMKSTDMAITLFEFTRNLRKECEHKIDAEITVEHDAEIAHKVIDYIFERIHQEVDMRGIVIDDILE